MEGKRISNSCWKKQLSEKLRNPAPIRDRRVAIVGMGSEVNGDDAAGILIARRLKERLTGLDRVLSFETGRSPENAVSQLRKFNPDVVVFIDAADLAEDPGWVAMIDPRTTTGASFSSHSMPFSMILEYLREQLDGEILLLGIQPQTIEFDDNVSRAVEISVIEVSEFLLDTLQCNH